MPNQNKKSKSPFANLSKSLKDKIRYFSADYSVNKRHVAVLVAIIYLTTKTSKAGLLKPLTLLISAYSNGKADVTADSRHLNACYLRDSLKGICTICDTSIFDKDKVQDIKPANKTVNKWVSGAIHKLAVDKDYATANLDLIYTACKDSNVKLSKKDISSIDITSIKKVS